MDIDPSIISVDLKSEVKYDIKGHHNHELPWDNTVIGTADFKFEAKFLESINFRIFGPSHLLSWSGGSLFFLLTQAETCATRMYQLDKGI